jgi:hypothetical protein
MRGLPGFALDDRDSRRLLLRLFVGLGRRLGVLFRLGFRRRGVFLGFGRRRFFFLRLGLGGFVGSCFFRLGRLGILGRGRAGLGRV